MKIDIIFGTYLRDLYGKKKTSIRIDLKSVSVREVLDEVYRTTEGFLDRLKEKNFLRNGYPRAVYIVESDKVSLDFIIKKDTELKILLPIGGG